MLMARVTLCALLLSACGDEDDPTLTPIPDAAPAPLPDAAAAMPDAQTQNAVQRGEYLVRSVMSCNTCHTPLLNGAPDMTRFLSGRECFIDVSPPNDNGMGCVHSRNLTNHETGLKNRTDAQIKTMLTQGMRPDGKLLHAAMPYWLFQALTDDDANAIIAFLRTLPGVDHQVPGNEAPFDNIAMATPAVTDAEVPAAGGTGETHASAERGRYLARVACGGCHTPALSPPVPRPEDYTRMFQGGRAFMGIPVQPAGIYSANLTPDATGLMGWSVEDVVKVLKQGKDRAGKGVCPPMPAGPMGVFGGLSDGDAADIATYLLNLAPAANAIAMQCSLP
jgi:mono/diheme cytochrome c family protein